MNTLLLTAFDAFGSLSENPSETVLTSLHEEGVIKLVLPTIYGKAEDILIKKLQKEKPKAILLLGYSKAANPIKLELFARNRDSKIAQDNLGQIGREPIIVGAPDKLPSTLPISEIEKVWNSHRIAYKTSENAGGFLCNHVSYVLLHWLTTHNLNTPCGFIHIGKGYKAIDEGQKAVTLLVELLKI